MAVLISVVVGCGSDEVSVSDELRGDPACAWVADTYVHFADGSVRLIYDEDKSFAATACLCMSETEFESKSRYDELNELALEICLRFANQHEHEWNECQDAYEDGRWLELVAWSRGRYESPTGEALGCVGE